MTDAIEPISPTTAVIPVAAIRAYNPNPQSFSNNFQLKSSEPSDGNTGEEAGKESYKETPMQLSELGDKRDNIADLAERQRLWTEIMRNHELSPDDRLKASELLGKSEGDFT